MAVSPNVSAWMNRQQATHENAEQIFVRNFSTRAFEAFRAKVPELMEYIVSFRVLASDLKNSNAFGCFIIRSGNDIQYIPIVMSGCSLEPCELLYDRREDRFRPLLPDTVDAIRKANMVTDHKTVSPVQKVEDTRSLFRRLVRPPCGSSVILASSSANSVAGLPVKARVALRGYLKEQPGLLAKIAEFYPVEKLGASLVVSEAEEPRVESPTVLRLADLNRENSGWLTGRQKEDMRVRGYTLVNAVDSPGIAVIRQSEAPLEGVFSYTWGGENDCCSACTSSSVEENDRRADDIVGEGFLAEAFRVGLGGVESIPVLVMGGHVFDARGACLRMEGGYSLLLRKSGTTLSGDELKKFGAFGDTRRFRSLSTGRLLPILRNRRGYPCAVRDWDMFGLRVTACEGIGRHPFIAEKDGSVYITPGENWQPGFILSPLLEVGWLGNRMSGWTLPKGTLWMHLPDDMKRLSGLLRNIDDFWRAVRSISTLLVIQRESGVITVTDRREEKTAGFADEAGAAEFIVRKYGLGPTQVRKVLDSERSFLFGKTAAALPEATEASEAAFEPDVLSSFVELGDSDELPLGILASFSNDPDVREQLLDFLPDFERTGDKLGRCILLFGLKKKDLSDYYGAEELDALMASCRKVFSLIGGIVFRLRSYINMV